MLGARLFFFFLSSWQQDTVGIPSASNRHRDLRDCQRQLFDENDLRGGIQLKHSHVLAPINYPSFIAFDWPSSLRCMCRHFLRLAWQSNGAVVWYRLPVLWILFQRFVDRSDSRALNWEIDFVSVAVRILPKTGIPSKNNPRNHPRSSQLSKLDFISELGLWSKAVEIGRDSAARQSIPTLWRKKWKKNA